MNIKQLQQFLNGQFDLIPKSLGVELVNCGFLKYKKLTSENYTYWFYEVSDLTKIDKKVFTFDWGDLIPTKKLEMIKQYIIFHKETENIYRLINNVLNIENAKDDGVCLENFYYSKNIQLNLY